MRIAIPILALLIAGCSLGPMPSAATLTAHPEWQHYFNVSYDVEPHGETRTVRGYVTNEYGVDMTSVQLLVQALDATDHVVSQRLAWVPGGVPAFGRSYFELSRLPATEKYRVTVWSFERLERNSPWL